MKKMIVALATAFTLITGISAIAEEIQPQDSGVATTENYGIR